MDFATLIGIILGVVAVVVGMVVKGADVMALVNPAAALIIFVGTFAAVCIAFPMNQLKKIPKLFKVLFGSNKKDLSYEQLLELFVHWTSESRKYGILSLEQQLDKIQDEFLLRGMKFVIDGVSAEDLEQILEAELEAIEERHAKGAAIFSQAGTYAPTLGVLGAVIGLVAALGNLTDIEKLGHAISGAFIATIFGIFSGYILWHPFANKLKQKSAAELEKKRLIIDCLLMLQEGTYPFIMKNRILGALSATERKKLEKGQKKMRSKKNRRSKKKKHEEHIDETWLIPYSDMLTLLFALFIVLFAMSSIDAAKFKQMAVAFRSELAGGTGNKEFLSDQKPNDEKELSASSLESEKIKKNAEAEVKQQEMNELKAVQKGIDKYIEENRLSSSFKTDLTEKGLKVTILENVLFDSGKADVKLESLSIAKEMSNLLVSASPREITVSGHTDNVPIANAQFASNWELSTQRAVNFMQVLLQNKELQPGKFSAVGYGEYRSIAPNDTQEGKAKNRRVEVFILPLTRNLQ